MAGIANSRAALTGIGKSRVTRHVHRPLPTRIAIELMNSNGMPGKQEHVPAFSRQTNGHLRPGNPGTNHGHSLISRIVNELEARVKDVINRGGMARSRGRRLHAKSPVWPVRILRRSQSQDSIARFKLTVPIFCRGSRKTDPNRFIKNRKAVGPTPYVEFPEPKLFDHLVTVKIEELQCGPRIRPRKRLCDSTAATRSRKLLERARRGIKVVNSGGS